MCRWLAYSGTPIRLEELLVKRDRSLIDQSLHSRLGATTTNGDGFGVGWYDDAGDPRLYRSTHPAWNDRNLRELAAGVSSPLFFAHIRASTGTAIQETNTHPFRHGRWLWMHNGLIRDFARLRRELVLAVEDSLFTSIEGTTDSELMFYLALTFGLEDDPVAAVGRMVGFVEETGRSHGIEQPIQMTVASTDGRTIWAFRYSSEGDSRSLSFSTRMDTLKAPHSELEELGALSERDQGRRLRAARRPPGGVERGARVPRRNRATRRGRTATVFPDSVAASSRRSDDARGAQTATMRRRTDSLSR